MLDIDFVSDDTTTVGASPSSVSATVVLFNAMIYATGRYAPEYLRVLGAHSVVIGLFGSVVMLLAVAYPRLDVPVRDPIDGLGTVGVIGGLASLGFVCWLVAPQLARLWPVPAWVSVVVGAVLVGSWRSFGLDTAAVVAGRIGPLDRVSRSVVTEDVLRLAVLVGGVSLVTVLLASVSGFVVGFQVALAIAASLGVTVAVVLHHADVRPGSASPRRGRGGSKPLSDVRSLPRRLRPLLIGDTLVQFALGMVSVFVVVTVTSVLQVEAHVVGYRLEPSTFFGVLLLVELSVALAAVVPTTRLASNAGRVWIVLLGFLVSASFPLLLVGVPATPVVVGVLFAFFGLRLAGRPARRALIADTITETETDGGLESYRLLRDAVTVPSALLGGVLYAISPTFAFTLATVIGVIGVREFMEFAIRPYVE